MEPSTVVMVGILDNPINIANAFRLLAVVNPVDDDGKKIKIWAKSRRRIPYYGTPDIIVTARYGGQVRGVRSGGGQMSSMVSIDLQTCEKNLNLKLSKRKIQLTGAKNEEMGIHTFNLLCSHLQMAQENLSYVQSLPKGVQVRTIEWFLDFVKGEEVIEYPDDEECLSDWSIRPFVTDEFDTPKGVDHRMVMFLWTYAMDCEVVGELPALFDSLLSIDKICSVPCSVVSYFVSNAVYNYSFGRPVPLVDYAFFLQREGFHATLHNWSSSSVKICSGINAMVPSLDEDGDPKEPDPPTSKKIKLHRFTVSAVGTVKQTSPTFYAEAKEKHDQIVSITEKFFHLIDTDQLPPLPCDLPVNDVDEGTDDGTDCQTDTD